MLLAIEQNQFLKYGVVLVLIVWWLYLQLPVQAMPIPTKVVISNPVHGEV